MTSFLKKEDNQKQFLIKIIINLYTVRIPIVHRATIFLQNFLVDLIIEFFLIQDPSDPIFTK